MSENLTSALLDKIEKLQYENRELKIKMLSDVYISQRQYDELMLKVRKAEMLDAEYGKLKAELESIKNTTT